MPTVVLLDISLSMKRPVSTTGDLKTRLTLATDGLEKLFTYFEQVFPLEYVALLSFSSTCELMVPFTRDHSELREALSSVSVLDITDLTVAMESFTEMVTKEWGMFVPVQLILVTDGVLGLRKSPNAFAFPFPCQLNVVCVATRDELTSPHHNKLNRISQLLCIPTSDIVVPNGTKLSRESVCQAFLELSKTVFYPYNGILRCGHLQSNINLSPSPRMTQSISKIVTDPHHSFENPYIITEFPTELLICGFLDMNILSAPAVFSKHFLIDAESTEGKMGKLLKTLLDDNEIPEEISDEASKPSFRVLLHGSLKCESKAAVIQLGDNWFAFLSSVASSSKKSNLILTVLFPDAEVPWLGQIRYLGPKSSGSDPRLLESGKKDHFPVSVPHMLSYQAPASLFWAKEAGLQNDITKVLRYSHKLPEKEASLMKELNKLRQVVFTYSLPNLMDTICHILSTEEVSAPNPQSKAILQRCIQFLSTNNNPQDRLLAMSSK